MLKQLNQLRRVIVCFPGVRSLVVRSFHCTYTTRFKSLENCNNRATNDPEHFIQQNTLQRILSTQYKPLRSLGLKFYFRVGTLHQVEALAGPV